jgi:hypothetical protein
MFKKLRAICTKLLSLSRKNWKEFLLVSVGPATLLIVYVSESPVASRLAAIIALWLIVVIYVGFAILKQRQVSNGVAAKARKRDGVASHRL